MLSGIAVVLVAAGAYVAGRHYPVRGPMVGTVAPASHDDVDRLMRSDAFRAMAKAPAFRTLAQDPGFQALAMNARALTVMAADPVAFQDLAGDAQAFRAAVAGAARASAPAEPKTPKDRAMTAMAAQPQAFQALASNAQALAAFARNGAAFRALAGNADFRTLMTDPAFPAALQSPRFSEALDAAKPR